MTNPADMNDAQLVACVNEFFARAIAGIRNQDKDEWFQLSINCSGYTNSGSSIELKHEVHLGINNTSRSTTGNLIQSVVNVNQVRYLDKAAPTTHITLALPAPVEAEFTEVEL